MAANGTKINVNLRAIAVKSSVYSIGVDTAETCLGTAVAACEVVYQ